MQNNENVSEIVAKIFNCTTTEITAINPIKKGMTNHSYTFVHQNKKYILRMPGEGTNKLIDRQKEYDVYQKIIPLDIADEIIHIDPILGYKITLFWENARVCDVQNPQDVAASMATLRNFHNANLTVKHKFCPFEKIEFYESLWKTNSEYADYSATKKAVLSLKSRLQQYPKQMGLAHIDAVPDNFIFINGGEIRLIDWEYSAMQDQHIDIAMFAVYAMYERAKIEQLIDAYFCGGCPPATRGKIYAYIAICGLLWSNWCEYKKQLGVEFGKYALAQYQFAKDYYAIFEEEI
ncbi:MAG: choline kinase family protein [Defluviitaleaceae bacterium]|nr:choline kinase family protein [Defluviitaleaceae bacterium]